MNDIRHHCILYLFTTLLVILPGLEAAGQQPEPDSTADSTSINTQNPNTTDQDSSLAADTLNRPTGQTQKSTKRVSPATASPPDTAITVDSTSVADVQNNKPNSVIRDIVSFRKIAMALVAIILTYLFNLILARLLDTFSERFSSYRLFTKRLIPILRIAIWVFAFYIILEGIFDPPLETIIAVGASLGIAVGFASQDILKNIFGGIMIILDRPFQVGDKIQVDEHYGEVTRIGLRSSRIVTPDDSSVAIPNAEIMNKAVSNTNSGALDCQVVAEIYLPVGTNVAHVKEIAQNAAYVSKYVYLKKPVSVIVINEMHEHQFVIKLRVKAYVFDIRYEFPFKSDLTERILQELDRKKINVYLPKNG